MERPLAAYKYTWFTAILICLAGLAQAPNRRREPSLGSVHP